MNICVFASGLGSNFRSILDSISEGYLTSKVKLLITNNSACGAAQIAHAENIECIHISRKKYPLLDDDGYGQMFLKEMQSREIDFVVLCGYMKEVPAPVLDEYRNRIINIHPALLPSFGGKGMYGKHVHEEVIKSGLKVSGLTIHFVEGGYDSGRIIYQECCQITGNDNAHTLESKVRKLEQHAYPYVIKKFEQDKVVAEGNRIKLID